MERNNDYNHCNKNVHNVISLELNGVNNEQLF